MMRQANRVYRSSHRCVHAAACIRIGGSGGARAATAAYTTRSDRDVAIVATARTPIGSFMGSLSAKSAVELGVAATAGVLARAGVDASDIDETYLGNVVGAGLGQAPARQVTLGAGIPNNVPCTTVNKVCASGMKTVMLAAGSIALGHNDIVLAGGFESMSNIPYYLPGARAGYKYGNGALVDGVTHDGLWDVYNDFHMGMCAEDCATKFGFTREQQDEFALASYARAAEAIGAGRLAAEIVPVELKTRKGVVTLSEDEEYKNVVPEKVPKLRAAFKKDGTVTAANASSLNDGACSIVLASRAKVESLGLKPLAWIRGYGDAAHAPIEFTTAPSKAVPVALKRAGLAPADVDYHEINEAFACVVLANMELQQLDPARVNVNGGAVALGHPIGMSGARIIGALANVLEQNDARIGVASICNGGGGASAIVIERA